MRYRYDEEKKKRYKTVELIVDEAAWEPNRRRFAGDTLVGLQVAFQEVELRNRIKRAGGTWNPERKVWEIRYDRARELGLEERVVSMDHSKR